MRKRVPVEERKLGREQADGLALHPAFGDKETKIVIDPRLNPRQKFKITIHEALHHAYPAMSESEVKRGAAKVCDILWRRKYRLTQQ
jgi:hypothetical protein